MRQKRTRARKHKVFGKLPVSAIHGNVEAWLRDGSERFRSAIAKKKRDLGLPVDANVFIPLP